MKHLIIILAIVLNSIFVYSQTFRDSIDVTHYDIHLKIDLQHKQIKGHSTAKITSKYNLDRVGLDLWGLFIDSLFINNQKITSYNYNSVSFYVKYKLPAQDTVQLTVYYHGRPHQDPIWGGFYFSKIDAFNYGVGLRSFPHSLGRAWFPANDIFTDKASFDFYIITDTNLMAVCNGTLLDSNYITETKHIRTKIIDSTTHKLKDFDTTLTKTYRQWHWRLAQPIPAYLASVGVSNYKHKFWTYNGINRKIPVKIFYLNYIPDTALAMFNFLDSVMNDFENLFGAYPWPRIGFLQTTMQGGAMEHATNISLPKYVFTPKQKNKDLIVHELSHSWFGDLVTCKTAKDMWLNEGWAEYCASLYKEKLYNEDVFRNSNRERHLYTLAFAHKEDGGYKAIGNIDSAHTYGMTVYNKGADVVHTLRYQIGDSIFWPVIRKYLKTYAYKNISIREFQHYLEKQTGQNLQNFFDFWLFSAGFPHFELYSYDIKKVKGKYQISTILHQREVATDSVLKNQRIQLEFFGHKNKTTTITTTITGEWTYDTTLLDFKPTLIIVDPNEHIADARISQKAWINEPGAYYFDYEFVTVQVNKLKPPTFLRIVTHWLAPEGNFPKNYIIQKNYYWTLQTNRPKKLKMDVKFYLTTLMDINFTHLTLDQIMQNLTVFYRPNPYTKWQETSSKITSNGEAIIVEDAKPGDYVLALKR